WQVSGGAFGQGSGDVDANGQDQGYGLTARFTAAPYLARDRVLHLGFGVSRRTPDAGVAGTANRIRLRARPETDVNQARFYSTGRIANSEYEMLYNVEFATVRGPASGQAEFTMAEVHCYGGRPTANFWSGYAFVSYFLTGETRRYLPHEGEFDRIYPRSSRGAWEIAARYSTIDLNDNSAGVGILGGRGNNYTLGLNWYVNPNLRFMANYVRVVTDGHSIPDQGTAPLIPGDKFNVMQVRASLAL
ncbi:MAG TPA: porin, partial [Gemmatimonadales bacterium]|nr:porin [Gemmatimonadales bacterium]